MEKAWFAVLVNAIVGPRLSYTCNMCNSTLNSADPDYRAMKSTVFRSCIWTSNMAPVFSKHLFQETDSFSLKEK